MLLSLITLYATDGFDGTWQAFHVLYHTQNNVLLGAPTGSGKTISAELAMLHLFNTAPDMKVQITVFILRSVCPVAHIYLKTEVLVYGSLKFTGYLHSTIKSHSSRTNE